MINIDLGDQEVEQFNCFCCACCGRRRPPVLAPSGARDYSGQPKAGASKWRWLGDWTLAERKDGLVVSQCPDCQDKANPGWKAGTIAKEQYEKAQERVKDVS